jgi:hypothetical protein
MAPFTGTPTEAQQIALALTPKITAALSITGSSYIIFDARRSHHVTSYHRLMIGLSTFDLFMSLGLFTSTWFMPADTPNVKYAMGTTTTCEVSE